SAPMPVVFTLYNRGRDTVSVSAPSPSDMTAFGAQLPYTIAPGQARTDTVAFAGDTSVSQPYWLRTPRNGSLFTQRMRLRSETVLTERQTANVRVRIPSAFADAYIMTPVAVRIVDPVKGEMRRLAGSAPVITLTV